MAGEKSISIPASKANGDFDLAVMVETASGSNFCSGRYQGVFGGACHTMGLWFHGGNIMNERQCGPHPGTSRIACSKLRPSTKYWIQISRRGSKGVLEVYTVGESNQPDALVARSQYSHTVTYKGVQTLGEAHPGSERFNGKIFCLRDSMPPKPPNALDGCNVQKDPDGMTGQKSISIPASKVNGDFDLAVMVETASGNNFCS